MLHRAIFRGIKFILVERGEAGKLPGVLRCSVVEGR